MILGKGAYRIHQSGKWYTNENIDQMLMERHMAKKARNAKKKHHLKGPTKRSAEDDQRFEESLRRLIDSVTKWIKCIRENLLLSVERSADGSRFIFLCERTRK